MDPEHIRELLTGHQDIITPAAKMEAEVFKSLSCPVCGSKGAEKIMDPPKVIYEEDGDEVVIRAPFTSTSPLIQGYARCITCRTEYSQTTGVIRKQDESVLTHPGFTDE